MIDKYIEYQISSFFDCWRKRTQFIKNLMDQNLKENRYEIEVLIWASFDALSNLWAESKLGTRQLSQRIRFDNFLANYGGETFQLISLPDIWHRIEIGEIILEKDNKKNVVKELSQETCDFLRYIHRPRLNYTKLKDLEFPWQRVNRQITDDVKLEDLLTQLLNKFSDLRDHEQKLRYWLRNSRYGHIAYKEMRSAYIHYGKPGNKAHGYVMSGNDTRPTYCSCIYSSSGFLGFSPQFMLTTLCQCIDSFEREAQQYEIDPYPDYKGAVEHYFQRLLEYLLVYQFCLDFSDEKSLNHIESTRRKLLEYLKDKNAKDYLKNMHQELYFRIIPKLKYEYKTLEDLPKYLPYDLEKIIQENWLPFQKSPVEMNIIEKQYEEMNALELAGDLVGCVEGPEDLATNKEYFQGFGE